MDEYLVSWRIKSTYLDVWIFGHDALPTGVAACQSQRFARRPSMDSHDSPMIHEVQRVRTKVSPIYTVPPPRFYLPGSIKRDHRDYRPNSTRSLSF